MLAVRPDVVRLGALAAPILALAGSGACTVDPTGSELPAPAADLIYMFYPTGSTATNGLVRGRGLPEAAPRFASYVVIESHPTGYRVVRPVEADGSFEFQVVALSGDVVEFRGATSEAGTTVGAPTFIRVPASIEPFVPQVCCPDTQTCQSIYEREAGLDCPAPAPALLRCEADVDCAPYENEVLPLAEDQVDVTRPNANGTIRVEGRVLPNVLVTLANVGRSSVGAGLAPDEAEALGLTDPGLRLTTIADDLGRFVFEDVEAAGDDEIVVQLFDLRGFRSPPYAQRVPDPDLAGVDVLGAFAWSPLTEGRRGQVAVRIAPYGIDGRGICPDGLDDPDGLELCLGGGLDHSMVDIQLARMDDPTAPDRAVHPTPTATTAAIPYNRGIEGNVRAPPLDLVLVVDRSATSQSVAQPDVYGALRSYARFLRSRDRVGLVLADEEPGLDVPLTLDRELLDQTLAAAQRAEGTDDPDATVLSGVEVAGSALRAERSESGRIVVVSFAPPAGRPAEARAALDDVLDLVERNRAIGFDGYRVDVVTVAAPYAPSDRAEAEARMRVLEDLATFSRGRWLPEVPVDDLGPVLSDLRGDQAGSFLLLYDMDIPPGTGKAGTLFLELRLDIPGSEPRTTSFRGPVRVANASNP